jgi:subtilase family serine protease
MVLLVGVLGGFFFAASPLPSVAASAAVDSAQTVLPGCARGPIPTDWATCNEVILAGADQGTLLSLAGQGYSPSQLRSAYGLTSASNTDGVGQTVAVIEAYHNPDLESNLAHYRSSFGLPPCGAGCLTVVNQNGDASPLPTKNNQGWASEESLDVDMVSAICPNCHILVVEANTQSNANLGAAENAAAKLGVNAISNSFGSTEAAADLNYNRLYFDHPGIAVTAGNGDSGYEVEYPAASPYVTAVGGTTLKTSSNARGWSETVWPGTGSGCSTEEIKPTWQTDTGCAQRTVGDTAFDADPTTGVAVYDTDCSLINALLGVCILDWGVAGGTSVGAPAIASIYALAGNSASVTGANTIYADPQGFYDITKGSNGTCSPAYLCTAEPGYDGPTGLGTPKGIGGF